MPAPSMVGRPVRWKALAEVPVMREGAVIEAASPVADVDCALLVVVASVVCAVFWPVDCALESPVDADVPVVRVGRLLKDPMATDPQNPASARGHRDAGVVARLDTRCQPYRCFN